MNRASERRRKPRPNLRKLMFVLPNLFTVSSIFCGVYSITVSAGETGGDGFYRAAIAIFFGNFFDAFAGRGARLTRPPSAVLVLVLSFLMVSSIRYRTFKEAGLTPRTLLAFLGVILVFVFFAVRGRISQVFLVYFSFYILLGIAEELL